ncbi:hypothetical protein B0T20DRAFT_406808 [Sordaria brevicollis]|uniref:DUF7707 domain-containing protein n=1 Tax=Sordaria brevicollis TaxID=83679 RepID=A0AAE0UD20_SORBR|nr:hypothetical protein B0T20DRAFT_406808 [Sordaria brevicollis]
MMLHQAFLSILPLIFAVLTPVLAADYNFSPILPINSIPDDTKNEWCNKHVETCDYVCGKGAHEDKDGKDIDNGGTKANDCIYTTLEYRCFCNKHDPNDASKFMKIRMEKYYYSVPALMCREADKLCEQNFKDDEEKKKECDEKIYSQCGKTFTKQQWSQDRVLAAAWRKNILKQDKREVAFLA